MIWAALGAGTLSAGTGAAEEDSGDDRVWLVGGDRISGRIERMVDGVLTVKTAYAGTVEIEFKRVTGLETAGSVTLKRREGEALRGSLEPGTPGEVRVAIAPGKSPVTVALEALIAINPPPESTVEYRAEVTLGAQVQRGNSDQTTLSASAEAERKSKRNRLSLRLRWNDTRESGQRTAHSAFGAFKVDRFYTSSFYSYAGAELYSDEFSDLDLRRVWSVGLGFDPISTDRLRISVEGGTSYIDRDFLVAPDEEELTVRAAAKVEWTIRKRLTVSDQVELLPSFEGSGLQLRNEFELATEFGAGWGLELANVLEYDGKPAAGVEAEDLLWTFSLLYAYR